MIMLTSVHVRGLKCTVHYQLHPVTVQRTRLVYVQYFTWPPIILAPPPKIIVGHKHVDRRPVASAGSSRWLYA